MTEQDALQRFIFEHLPVRGEYVKLQNSFKTIVNQHPYPPAIQKLLGEALCVAALLSAIIKFEGRLTVQFRGSGKLKLLLAQCNNDFELRGLAKWDKDLPYEDLMASFNDGVLVITLDMGGNKNRYQGIVAWRGNSLADSIEGYFRESEQLATKIWLSVNSDQAVGFLLQVVPDSRKVDTIAEESSIDTHWRYVLNEASDLRPEDMFDLDYKDLLNNLFPHDDLRVFKTVPVAFKCTCSRKSGADAIRILGKEEAEEELKNNRTIVVTCDFCNQEYIYDREDVNKIFSDQNDPSSNSQLH